MSYIVPDKIPSYCAECDWSICLYPNAYCKRVHKTSELLMATKKRPDFCPLIEVHAPHGRLADLDQIIDKYWDGGYMRIDESDLKAIDEYDVVIEAEE